MYLLSNTTIWWIYILYYIENNYMFRCLIMAIFRLYMKHLVSSYTKHIYIYIYIWATYVGQGGGKVDTRSRICPKGCMGCRGGPCCYQSMSKLIIDKSMVGIILCLSVLRN
jgi:hypothetical protein